MKKSLIISLAVIIVIAVGSCFVPWKDLFFKEEPLIKEEPLTLEDFKQVDGATARFPLAVAVANKYLNDDVEKKLKFNKTAEALKNVIDGKKAVAITSYPGDDQFAYAKEKGVELECIKVANEAFVFLVNQDNKVDNLTQQQIKDIYSGKITNWKTVGGADSKIIALQRNKDSGSQNGMLEFMGEVKLASAPIEYEIESMGRLVEGIVKPYDNSFSAIGYSYYYYVNSMYIRQGIKMIGVDGVIPSNETIKDGTYPVNRPTYLVIRKDSDETSIARRLVKYFISDEGQQAIADDGYVPIR